MAGYTTASYGYYRPPAPPRPRVTPGFEGGSLAAAAAGGAVSPTNPFGLSGGPQNQGAAPGSAPPISYGTPKPPAVAAAAAAPPPPGSVAGQSGSAPVIPTAASQAYDINADPAFQATQALTGMGDEQAQAAALKGKRDTLLGYGDANLAQSVLGDSTLAQAAAQNPTSTLAQLGQQRGRNIHDLTEGLNKNNLLYSGYRVTQEQQGAQDYQNALAQAASAVNGNLGSIDSQLASALGNNQAARIQAMRDAYALHAQDVGAPTAPPADTPAGSGGGVDTSAGNAATSNVATAPDYATDPYAEQNALALASARKRQVMI